ncbi:putative Calcium/calmodulin-dependent protein kinase type 1 [Blattamonas nauphoetae]|uniref:Calcium/calmodulin-dependent protein kinase type 1 n=1 Tax=Blattamonas nauphoetae TaxID=2049346 RepID=A0ABQ9XJG5_9EUKA|nr:putative Calcium/calmodulin-dependent protein kinase type 1 [Blattamonas nauphoetae]
MRNITVHGRDDTFKSITDLFVFIIHHHSISINPYYQARGAFGHVFAVDYNERRCAAKLLFTERTSVGDCFAGPFFRQKKISSQNLIKVFKTIIEDDYSIIVMELASLSDLRKVCAPGNIVPERTALKIVFQILSGLSILHSHDSIHRDIKPGNIIAHQDEVTGKVCLKIADFGLMKIKATQSMTFCGTPVYMAPELTQMSKTYSSVVDCWSVGVILYELLAGRLPYPEGYSPTITLQDPKCSPSTLSLLKSLLEPNETKRINAQSALLEAYHHHFRGSDDLLLSRDEWDSIQTTSTKPTPRNQTALCDSLSGEEASHYNSNSSTVVFRDSSQSSDTVWQNSVLGLDGIGGFRSIDSQPDAASFFPTYSRQHLSAASSAGPARSHRFDSSRQMVTIDNFDEEANKMSPDSIRNSSSITHSSTFVPPSPGNNFGIPSYLLHLSLPHTPTTPRHHVNGTSPIFSHPIFASTHRPVYPPFAFSTHSSPNYFSLASSQSQSSSEITHIVPQEISLGYRCFITHQFLISPTKFVGDTLGPWMEEKVLHWLKREMKKIRKRDGHKRPKQTDSENDEQTALLFSLWSQALIMTQAEEEKRKEEERKLDQLSDSSFITINSTIMSDQTQTLPFPVSLLSLVVSTLSSSPNIISSLDRRVEYDREHHERVVKYVEERVEKELADGGDEEKNDEANEQFKKEEEQRIREHQKSKRRTPPKARKRPPPSSPVTPAQSASRLTRLAFLSSESEQIQRVLSEGCDVNGRVRSQRVEWMQRVVGRVWGRVKRWGQGESQRRERKKLFGMSNPLEDDSDDTNFVFSINSSSILQTPSFMNTSSFISPSSATFNLIPPSLGPSRYSPPPLPSTDALPSIPHPFQTHVEERQAAIAASQIAIASTASLLILQGHPNWGESMADEAAQSLWSWIGNGTSILSTLTAWAEDDAKEERDRSTNESRTTCEDEDKKNGDQATLLMWEVVCSLLSECVNGLSILCQSIDAKGAVLGHSPAFSSSVSLSSLSPFLSPLTNIRRHDPLNYSILQPLPSLSLPSASLVYSALSTLMTIPFTPLLSSCLNFLSSTSDCPIHYRLELVQTSLICILLSTIRGETSFTTSPLLATEMSYSSFDATFYGTLLSLVCSLTSLGTSAFLNLPSSAIPTRDKREWIRKEIKKNVLTPLADWMKWWGSEETKRRKEERRWREARKDTKTGSSKDDKKKKRTIAQPEPDPPQPLSSLISAVSVLCGDAVWLASGSRTIKNWAVQTGCGVRWMRLWVDVHDDEQIMLHMSEWGRCLRGVAEGQRQRRPELKIGHKRDKRSEKEADWCEWLASEGWVDITEAIYIGHTSRLLRFHAECNHVEWNGLWKGGGRSWEERGDDDDMFGSQNVDIPSSYVSRTRIKVKNIPSSLPPSTLTNSLSPLVTESILWRDEETEGRKAAFVQFKNESEAKQAMRIMRGEVPSQQNEKDTKSDENNNTPATASRDVKSEPGSDSKKSSPKHKRKQTPLYPPLALGGVLQTCVWCLVQNECSLTGQDMLVPSFVLGHPLGPFYEKKSLLEFVRVYGVEPVEMGATSEEDVREIDEALF